MIHILFPAGAFGTTIEYCLKRFSKEFRIDEISISESGSMHLYRKEYHPARLDEIKQIPNLAVNITTPPYPNNEANVLDVINTFKTVVAPTDKTIFVTVNSKIEYYQTILLLCNKIDFIGTIAKYEEKYPTERYKLWNKNYTSYLDMEPWEVRDLFSCTHNYHIDDLLCASSQADDQWLIVKFDELLNNFVSIIIEIFNYTELTLVSCKELEIFHEQWIKKQQKIVSEQIIVSTILDNLSKNKYFSWGELSIIAESIIQFELTKQGIDFKCAGVNRFPNNTDDLLKLC